MRLTGMAAGLVMMAGVAMAQSYEVRQTSDGYLNLRAGPGTSSVILQRLYPGMTVQYLEERGNWLRVRLPDGTVGWASETFLEARTSFSGEILIVQPTSDGFLNLREGPGTRHAIKGRLFPGEQVVVIARSGNWTRVHGQRSPIGWVYSKYLGY